MIAGDLERRYSSALKEKFDAVHLPAMTLGSVSVFLQARQSPDMAKSFEKQLADESFRLNPIGVNLFKLWANLQANRFEKSMNNKCILCDKPISYNFFCQGCIEARPEITATSPPMSPLPDAYAQITLYPYEESGRKTPLFSTFGCPIKIEGKDDAYHDSRFYFESKTGMHPGESVFAAMKFLCPELLTSWLKVGMKFELWDRRFIGCGEVLTVTAIGAAAAQIKGEDS